jgi:2-oxoglutarate ferredoxin oxidoreductase subunit alpha
MQARWGSHGDYGVIALTPNSPQESFDLAIQAFNLSEEFRVPVLLMMDECVGHMTEKVRIPAPEKIEMTRRRRPEGPPAEYVPYQAGPDLVPGMVHAGEGYRIHVTGLTHDERGYPAMNPEAHGALVRRLKEKIERAGERLCKVEEDGSEEAPIVVVSYGITSRVAQRAIEMAREEGLKVGMLRLITVWPFPGWRIRQLAERVKVFVAPELNLGQIALEVERAAGGRARTLGVPHAGGTVHRPEDILSAIREAAR